MTTGTWIYKNAEKRQLLIKKNSITNTKVDVIMKTSEVPELPYNTFRFKFSKPMENPPTDSRFIVTRIDDYTFDYQLTEAWLSTAGWFSDKFDDPDYTVSLIAFGDIKGASENSITGLFCNCASLVSIDCELDLTNFIHFSSAFRGCTQLKDVSNIKFARLPETARVNNLFTNCYSIETNMVDIYELIKNGQKDGGIEGNPFTYCGVDPDGNYASADAQEGRAQIPEQWGGDLIVIAANTFRFQFTDPIEIADLPIDGRFTITKINNTTYDYTVGKDYLNTRGLFSSKFNNSQLGTNQVKLINVGDVHKMTDMTALFANCNSLIEICEFDTSKVTMMMQIFSECSALTTMPILDISKVATIEAMFAGCRSLTTIPEEFIDKFTTNKVCNVSNLFAQCTNIESGALELYNKLKSNNNPHNQNTFLNCGKDTTTGLAELEQIPIFWGGLLVESNVMRIRTSYGSNAYNSIMNNSYLNEKYVYTSSYNNYYDFYVIRSSNDWANVFLNNNYIVQAESIGDISGITSFYQTFRGCVNLTSAVLTGTTNLTSTESMFFNCVSLMEAPELDLSKTTITRWMYWGNISLTSVPTYDLSNATNIVAMYQGCKLLTSINITNTSKVIDAGWIFYGCTNLTELPTFDVTNVKYVTNFATDCINVTSGALHYYNIFKAVSGINYNSNTFLNCGSNTETGLVELKQIPESWGGLQSECEVNSLLVRVVDSDAGRASITGNTKFTKYKLKEGTTNEYYVIRNNNDWSNLFKGNTYLTNVLESGDLSSVTTMSYMFYGCSSLISLDLSNFDTSNVTNMRVMFFECNSLTSLDLSNFDTSNVTNMGGMFFECNSLTSLDLSSFDTSNVTDMSYMFYGCNSLTSLDLSNFDTSNVTDMRVMFYGCNSLTSLDLSNFDTSNVTNMRVMFFECNSLTSLDLSNFDTSNVTDMSYMFYGCNSLTSLDLSNFDTSNVTTMSYMFYGCSSLISLDLSNFDTSNVTDMGDMFVYCKLLTTLDLSNFDTSNVTDMYEMFYECNLLSIIPELNTTNVTDIRGFAYNCKNVESGALYIYNNVKNNTNIQYNTDTFGNCGSNTETGRAERAQIPQSWGGYKEE